MAHFKKLRKAEREEAIQQNIVREVSQLLGVSQSTVSRTFADQYKRPNPEIVAALKRALAKMGFSLEAAA